ncbi:MAG: threonine ammonia-lyase IlvA [Saprospiraceae bacterium]|nr:threonine ammonia-lyase IlvA [Candidatus Parvibacillus calidus]
MNLFEKVVQAQEKIKGVAVKTPLIKNENFSDSLSAQIWLKREDLQPIRSYKLRGAFNKIITLTPDQSARGVVCASAGNHAQGVAYACQKLGIYASIFMPVTTPQQKLRQVRLFGKEYVDIILKGDTFDDSFQEAIQYCNRKNAIFIHPFDDEDVIAGQGTVGMEIIDDAPQPIDYLFVPIGGGGLASGLITVFKKLSPQTKIIGVEPAGAASMKSAVERGQVIALPDIDKFVDGAAVSRVGDNTFGICQEGLSDIIPVPEGKVCSAILKLYNEEAIIVEPAGALTIAALDLYKDEIKGKNVVCIISGGNNDITRTEEIKERSLLYEGLKHYFMVNFPQRPGALKEFVNNVLGPDDDITYFQFSKKNNRENGPAVVGIELKRQDDFNTLKENLNSHNINFQYLNENADLFTHLIF